MPPLAVILYVDPGTGSFLIQSLIATLIGVFAFGRHTLRSWIVRLTSRKPPEPK